jgi:hypothetical protein
MFEELAIFLDVLAGERQPVSAPPIVVLQRFDPGLLEPVVNFIGTR